MTKRYLIHTAKCLALMVFMAGGMATKSTAEDAETICMPYPVFAGILKEAHGQTLATLSPLPNGKVIATFSAPNGEWSMLILHQGGVACMAGGGRGFEVVKAGVAL